MTRLERAARDYAIAALSTPRPPSDGDAEHAIAAAAVCDTVEDAYTECMTWSPEKPEDPTLVPAPRILRARVALYLRLMRRAEAWERAEIENAEHVARERVYERLNGAVECPHDHATPDDWAIPLTTLGDPPPISSDISEWRAAFDRWRTAASHVPWRPLWTAAPPHDPSPGSRPGTRVTEER